MHLLMILAGTVSGFEFVRFSALIRQQQVSRFALDSTTASESFCTWFDNSEWAVLHLIRQQVVSRFALDSTTASESFCTWFRHFDSNFSTSEIPAKFGFFCRYLYLSKWKRIRRWSVVETRENIGERTFIDFEVLREMETRNSSRVLEKRNSDHLKSEFEEEVLGWKRMGHRDSNSPLPIFFF